jgi:putative membrane protein
MLKQLIVVWVIVAAAIAITAWLLPSVEVDGGALSLLGVALLFGLVNALIGTLLRLVSLPLTLITFGLFGLVINGILLAITAGLTDVLDVGGFFATILAAVVISAVTAVLLLVAGRMFDDTDSAKPAAAS